VVPVVSLSISIVRICADRCALIPVSAGLMPKASARLSPGLMIVTTW
jgi:hypothetical protein